MINDTIEEIKHAISESNEDNNMLFISVPYESIQSDPMGFMNELASAIRPHHINNATTGIEDKVIICSIIICDKYCRMFDHLIPTTKFVTDRDFYTYSPDNEKPPDGK